MWTLDCFLPKKLLFSIELNHFMSSKSAQGQESALRQQIFQSTQDCNLSSECFYLFDSPNCLIGMFWWSQNYPLFSSLSLEISVKTFFIDYKLLVTCERFPFWLNFGKSNIPQMKNTFLFWVVLLSLQLFYRLVIGQVVIFGAKFSPNVFCSTTSFFNHFISFWWPMRCDWFSGTTPSNL